MKILLVLMSVFMSVALLAEDDCYIKMKDGVRFNASKLSADASGNITYETGASKIKSIVRRKDYVCAWVPKPEELKNADAAFKKKEFAKALEVYHKAAEDYKYLGWNIYAMDMEGQTLSAMSKKEEALKVLEELRKTEVKDPSKEDDFYYEGLKVMADLYIGMAKYKEAEAALGDISKSKNDDYSSGALIARGDIYLKQGKPKDAVLEYLQVILMYPQKKKQHPEALCKLANTLKSMNDSRAAVYAEKLKKEFPGNEFITQLK
jgi:tetratricopeptide (TPR) repeat protein